MNELFNEADNILREHWCTKHQWARVNDFIEVTFKASGKKVIRCRYCEQEKEERKKERQLEWYNHKKVLSDYYVKRKMGVKLAIANELPPEIIEAKRTTLELKAQIKKLEEPLLKCAKHGDLYLPDVNKDCIRYGIQKYKCKKCISDIKKKHYQLHKAKYLLKQNQFRKNNPDIIKKQRKRHQKTESFRAYRRRKERKNTVNLTDRAIKKIIVRHSPISMRDIPSEVIEAKRAILLLKRQINEISIGDRICVEPQKLIKRMTSKT